MAKKTKVDPAAELTDKILSSMEPEELYAKHMQATALEKHKLYIEPPRSIEDSYRFGWMRGIMLKTDTMLTSKWYKWLAAINKGEINIDDMPKTAVGVDIQSGSIGQKMLEDCMQALYREGYNINDFIEWIGYAFGIAWFEKPRISAKSWEYLFINFRADILLMEPADYFSHFVAIHGKSGHLDYFPTPMHITTFINRILNVEGEFNRTESQYEPCIGGGAMLLPSESLNLVGADLNPSMVKVACIQAFLYKPWLLYTPEVLVNLHFDKKEMRINRYFEFDTDTRIYQGDSILAEFKAPKNIFDEHSEFVDIYVSPIDLSKREIFKYEEDMQKDWDTLDRETKFNIVRAQAREIGFNALTTNPPFNASLAKPAKERIKQLELSNAEFLKQREERQKMKDITVAIFEEIINDVEIRITQQKGKKIDDNQYELVF